MRPIFESGLASRLESAGRAVLATAMRSRRLRGKVPQHSELSWQTRAPPSPQQASSWSSKVDWDLYERINPRANPDELSRYKGVGASVKASRSFDVSLQGIQDRLKSLAVDRANT